MNKNLTKNYAALKKTVPLLHNWIKEQPDIDWATKIYSSNGMDNLLIQDGSNRVAAYDMDDPMKQAELAAKEMKLYKENVSIVVGFGLGYLVKAIINIREKQHKIIVIEPCGHIIRMAMENFDFSKELLNGNLHIVAPGKNELSYIIGIISTSFVISDWLFTTDSYTRLRHAEYNELTEFTKMTLNQILCNTGTVAGDAGAKIADNDIVCMPYVIRHRGVAELRDLFKGKPAILVSTGPSLQKNIHHLIENQDKVVIIAVGQALRILLAYGIRPDFICSVDFGEVNIGHFNGLMDSGVPLVTINRTYAPLLKKWQGPKFIAATPVPGFERMATGILTKKGFVDAGGSVAHLCFGLAQLLGCNPITFIGQDLALGDTSHSRLADAGGDIMLDQNGQILWKVNDQRCSLHGNTAYSMGPATVVPGYFGKPVFTNMGLVSFLAAFQNMVANHKNTNKENIVFNATQGGANIKGCVNKPLADIIKEYCSEVIDKSKLKTLCTLADDGDELVSKVIPLLKTDIDHLNKIIKHSQKGIKSSKELKELISNLKPISKKLETKFKSLLKQSKKNPPVPDKTITYEDHQQSMFGDYNKLMRAVSDPKHKLIKRIIEVSLENLKDAGIAQRYAAGNPLVNVAIYGASRRIHAREIKGKEGLLAFLKDKENAKKRIDRSIFIFGIAEKAARSLKKSYQNTLRILKKYNVTKDNNILAPPIKEIINLDDAEAYFEKGNWAHPLLDAQKAIENGEKYASKIDRARQVYAKAEEMRNTAILDAQNAEKESIDKDRNLLEYNRLIEDGRELGKEKKFKEAVKIFENAVDLVDNNIDGRWGLATSLHHSGDISGSIEIYRTLVRDFPDNARFKFELGNVMLLGEETAQEGLKVIGEAMKLSSDFDSFLIHLGSIYEKSGMVDQAITAYDIYTQKFQHDPKGWSKYSECLKKAGKETEAEMAIKKAVSINPDYGNI